MKSTQSLIVGLVICLCVIVSSKATLLEVGSGQTYTTVLSAFDAALADTSQSHTIRIMDSVVYNERIGSSAIGTDGQTITIEAASSQTPAIYRIEHVDIASDIVLKDLIIDGTQRNSGTTPAWTWSLISFNGDAADGNLTIIDCTIKGTGSEATGWLEGTTPQMFTLHGCTFETDTKSIVFAANSNDALIENNHFKAASGAVIVNSRASTGSVMIRNNIFDQNQTGFYRKSATSYSNLTIENNTFYKCGGSNTESDGAIFFRSYNATDLDIVIKDNLFTGFGAASGKLVGIYCYWGYPTKLTATYNGFYDMRETASVQDVAYLGVSGQGGDEWQPVTALNAVPGSSNNTVGTVDPFVDAANGNFYLLFGSWPTTTASDGAYIGALPGMKPTGTVFKFM